MFKKVVKYLRTQKWKYYCSKCDNTFISVGWGVCPKCHNRLTQEIEEVKDEK